MIRTWLHRGAAFFAAGFFGVCATPVFAQPTLVTFPMLMEVRPVAARVGQTSEHVISSRFGLEGAFQVIVDGAGVTGEVMPEDAKTPDPAPMAAMAKPEGKANAEKKEGDKKSSDKKDADKKDDKKTDAAKKDNTRTSRTAR